MSAAFRRKRITTMVSRALALGAVPAGLGACSGEPLEESFAREPEAVVYGADDRREVAGDPAWQQLFADSVVALIPANRLLDAGDGRVEVSSMTLAEKYSVCDDARFALQPTAASCGGVLIESDLVLTAGHCFSDEPRCDQYAYVAGYAEVEGSVTLAAANVFGCRDVLARHVEIVEGSRHIDFALVRLDRPASARPVKVAADAPAVGQALAMLGFPSGLPGKLDTGGTVTENGASDHFQADVDAFAANSGSPVFDEDQVLRGLLVAGAPFDYEAAAGCWDVREVPAHEAASNGTERIALPRLALEALRGLEDAPEHSVRCTGLDCKAHETDEYQLLPPPPAAATSDPEGVADAPPAQDDGGPSPDEGKQARTGSERSDSGRGCSLAAPGSDPLFGAVLGALLGLAARRRYGRRVR
jgi:V8-like Glu-specific endopeptidase